MAYVSFSKMQGSGNDFILIDGTQLTRDEKTLAGYAQKLCRRKFGVGADGLLVIDATKSGFRMRIFNADGSEAEMCGNGARCTALWLCLKKNITRQPFEFVTGAGIVEARVEVSESELGMVTLKMTDPFDLRTGISLEMEGVSLAGHYLNTGVPHTVFFVDDLEKVKVEALGKKIRFHPLFAPAGTNVDFVQRTDKGIKIRTYERGVEAETLACGTGTVASAVMSVLTGSGSAQGKKTVVVETRSGEVLEVSFKAEGDRAGDVWLRGCASLVYEGMVLLQDRSGTGDKR